MERKRFGSVVLLVFVALSCANITINVYFSEQAVQKAADAIEDEIRSQVLEQPQAESESVPGPHSKASSGWLERLCPPAYAQEVDLNIDTPEIQKITESRKNRFPKIDDLLTKGVIGEGNDGLIKEKDIRSLPLKDVAAVRKLVQEENTDRQKLYQAIAKANNFTDDRVPEIGKNFAVTIREKLRPGQFYQDDKGAWLEKKAKKEEEKAQ